MAKAPELKFQKHMADFLVRVHRYGVLAQADITDTEHCIAEDALWDFLNATQADALKKLAADYSTDARDEVFKALRSELAQKNHVPAYIVFNNVSLDEMAELKPRTMGDFRRISGVGEAKASKYGEAFIKHIAKWVREHSEEE